MDKDAKTAFDSPWKTILENYFEDFLDFFFADIHQAVDWTKPYTFLDKELEQVIRDAETGNHYVDKLAKVYLTDGQQTVLYIHIEVQSQYDSGFSQRMFVYHYRLYDRYKMPVVSLAVLGDDRPKWKPSSYAYERFGCKHSLTFPIVKLLDYQKRWGELEKSRNPFSIVVRVHLKALETRKKPDQRLYWKFSLFKALHQEGYSRKSILELFHFMDWMLNLPSSVEQTFKLKLAEYEERKKMRYVTSIERMGIEQGREEGQIKNSRENIIEVLTLRFDSIPETLVKLVQQIDDLSILSLLHRKAVLSESLAAFEQVLSQQKANN